MTPAMETKLSGVGRIPFTLMIAIDIAVYAAAGALSYTVLYPLASLLLAALAVFHYWRTYVRTGAWFTPEGMFCLSWIGGSAVSALRLSRLQTVWSLKMWVLLCLATVLFTAGSALAGRVSLPQPKRNRSRVLPDDSEMTVRLARAAIALTIVSVICLITETAVLGYVPILSSKPHAYSYFHIKGVHYITVSAILVPALAVLYNAQAAKSTLEAGRYLTAVKVCAIISLIVPIICVSRFQLFFAVVLALLCYVLTGSRLNRNQILILAAAAVLAYVLLTVLRHHDVEYLNGIFEMRFSRMPIFITQPYMYIANNFDNLNCLVEQLPEHTHGVKMLAPLWSLSGLKAAHPELVNLPLYTTKKELTTLTIFYDSYYDFGFVGTGVLALVFGWCAEKIRQLKERSENPVKDLFYAQVTLYFMLAFFTTWASDLAVWFRFVLTGLIFFYVGRRKPDDTDD